MTFKHIAILTSVLALAACTGGSGGGTNGDMNNGIPNTPNLSLPNNKMDLVGNKLYSEWVVGDPQSSFLPVSSSLWYRKGYLDYAKNELKFIAWIPNGGHYFELCQNANGCEITYKNGEEYWDICAYEGSGCSGTVYNMCTITEGCSFEVTTGNYYVQYCRDTDGCVSETVSYSLNDFVNGKYSHTNEWGVLDKIVLGADSRAVPLRFSNFGYWTSKWEEDGSNMRDSITFIAGIPQKEVDMNTLTELNIVDAPQTYTGKAFAVIDSGEFINGSYANDGGFVAEGTARLTFDPNNGIPKERVMLGFSDAGWYNVSMDGDGSNLVFFGNPSVDAAFRVNDNRNFVSDITIKYYSDDTTMPATEAVGTAVAEFIHMEDDAYRTISFSFGAVKE